MSTSASWQPITAGESSIADIPTPRLAAVGCPSSRLRACAAAMRASSGCRHRARRLPRTAATTVAYNPTLGSPGRVAQRESARFTRERSLVRAQPCPSSSRNCPVGTERPTATATCRWRISSITTPTSWPDRDPAVADQTPPAAANPTSPARRRPRPQSRFGALPGLFVTSARERGARDTLGPRQAERRRGGEAERRNERAPQRPEQLWTSPERRPNACSSLGAPHGLLDAIGGDQLLKGSYHGAQSGQPEASLNADRVNARL